MRELLQFGLRGIVQVLLDLPLLHLELKTEVKLVAYRVKIGKGKNAWIVDGYTKK